MTFYLTFAALATLAVAVVSNAEGAITGLAAAAADHIAVFAAEPTAEEQAGKRLFQSLGCAGCHQPDATGRGPVLTGRFGSQVSDSKGRTWIVDAAYVRQAIVYPAAVVAAGFRPVMPTFGGQLTEGELQALVAYVRSLSAAPSASGDGGLRLSPGVDEVDYACNE
jgi:cytochrome c oxidase subunit 2